MKKIGLLSLLCLCGIIVFGAFPVETHVILTEVEPEGFKLDYWGFMIGILTMPFLIFYGLPLALLLVNKKSFRKSLALGWLAGLILIVLIVVAAESEFSFLY